MGRRSMRRAMMDRIREQMASLKSRIAELRPSKARDDLLGELEDVRHLAKLLGPLNSKEPEPGRDEETDPSRNKP